MKIINTILLATLLLSGCASLNTSEDNRNALIGTWELIQIDNIQPMDTPPWGAVTIVVVFKPDGEVINYIPGRERNSYPYRLEGDSLFGFVGISRDMDGPRKLKFYNDRFVEWTYSDGTIVFLRKVSDSATAFPETLKAVPYTTHGETYEPVFSSKIRQVTAGASKKADPSLVGQWELANNPNPEKQILNISSNGTLQQVYGDKKWDGTFEVYDDVLKVLIPEIAFSCAYSLEGKNKLILIVSSEEVIEFEKLK